MVKRSLKSPLFIAVIVCVCVFYSGIIPVKGKNRLICLISKNKICEISGTIISSPVKSSSGKNYSAKIKITGVKSLEGVYSGARGIITVYLPVQIVESYFPGKIFSTSVGKGNYIFEAGGKYDLVGRFINEQFNASSCVKSTWENDIFGKIDFFRALCRLHFKRMMYSWGNAGGLLLALLSGAREYTENSVKDAFKNAGLSHILALSGMHLSMFSSIALLIGNKIKRKKFTYILRIIVLLVFVWFAGFTPSLLRAFICSMLGIVVLLSGNKEIDIVYVLCSAFLIQCIISPMDIENAGFMLSYGALFGIIFMNSLFRKVFDKVLPSKISSSCSTSVSAQIFTAPISLKLFGSFAPGGIIASIFVSPLVTVFIYSGILLILFSLIFSFFVGPSGIFMNLQYNIIKIIVEIFSKIPRITV